MTHTLIKVAWLAVLLGLGLETAALAAGAATGTPVEARRIAADLVQKVSWSFIVCVGLALGSLSARAPVPGLSFAGLIAAPLGFTIARALHRGVAQALALEQAGPAAPAMGMALLKALEYACLGGLLALLAGRHRMNAGAYAGVGATVGMVFGAASFAVAPATAFSAALARAINELLFPVGCSLVLFTARILGTHLRNPAAAAPPHARSA